MYLSIHNIIHTQREERRAQNISYNCNKKICFQTQNYIRKISRTRGRQGESKGDNEMSRVSEIVIE